MNDGDALLGLAGMLAGRVDGFREDGEPLTLAEVPFALFVGDLLDALGLDALGLDAEERVAVVDEELLAAIDEARSTRLSPDELAALDAKIAALGLDVLQARKGTRNS